MKTVTAGDTCLFAFFICVVLHVTYGQTQVVLVTRMNDLRQQIEEKNNLPLPIKEEKAEHFENIS